MKETSFGKETLKELKSEIASTRKCIERIPEKLFDYKPHEKSMTMGYLALLVAEIPNWIAIMIKDGEIDFATYSHYQPANTEELVNHFAENIKAAEAALETLADDDLEKPFTLKTKGEVLYSSPLKESITQTINHLVHHRGQLTVYMRLNDIMVPSIYGPSADDKNFAS